MTGGARDRLGARAVDLGLAANVLLALGKTATGVVGHSPALLADGINSTSDVVYYVVVRTFMSHARKPPDREHPYGHTQLENIAAVVVGAFVIVTGLALLFQSVDAAWDVWIGDSVYDGARGYVLTVAVATILLKIGLWRWTRRAGKATGNAAVLALASDHRNDVIAASGAALGITLGRSGWPALDPLAGAFVALVVFRTGLVIVRESSADLMDSLPGRALMEQIRAVAAGVGEIRALEEVHARRLGPYLVLNVTVGVDGNLTVAEGDAIADRLERALLREVPFVRGVHVHYHPARIPVESAMRVE